MIIRKGRIDMIKYPNGSKKVAPTKAMHTKTSYADRGMNFEEQINQSNDYYRVQNKAIIYKKPTPIKVVKAGKNEKGTYQIQEAYFAQPSTTDYNGLYRGCYVDFEAKETRNVNLFSLSNIHAHQLEHLFGIVEHGGIAFILVSFVRHNEVYLLDASKLKEIVEGGAKSIRYEEFKKEGHLVPYGYQAPIEYLKVVDEVYFKDL